MIEAAKLLDLIGRCRVLCVVPCATSGMYDMKVLHGLGSFVLSAMKSSQCPLIRDWTSPIEVGQASRARSLTNRFPSGRFGSMSVNATTRKSPVPSSAQKTRFRVFVFEPHLSIVIFSAQYGSVRQSGASSPDGLVRLLRSETKVPVRLFVFY